MRKLNLFNIITVVSSFAMEKSYYTNDFLDGMDECFVMSETKLYFKDYIKNQNDLSDLKKKLDTIKNYKFGGEEGVKAVIKEYKEISNNIKKNKKIKLNHEIQELEKKKKNLDNSLNDKEPIGLAYEDHTAEIQSKIQAINQQIKEIEDNEKKINELKEMKKAYIRLYATFDHFNQESSKQKKNDIYYIKITEEQNGNYRFRNGEDNFNNKYVDGKGYAIRTSKLNKFFDAIHAQEGTSIRQFNPGKNVNPHITAVPVFGNVTQKQFQAELQKAIFEYSDVTPELDPVDYGDKLVLKLNLTNDDILKNNQLDWLNKFKTTNNNLESFHIHINTNVNNNFGNLKATVKNGNKIITTSSINYIERNWNDEQHKIEIPSIGWKTVKDLRSNYVNYQTQYKQKELQDKFFKEIRPFLGNKIN